MSKTVVEKKEFDFKKNVLTVSSLPILGYIVYKKLKKEREAK